MSLGGVIAVGGLSVLSQLSGPNVPSTGAAPEQPVSTDVSEVLAPQVTAPEPPAPVMPLAEAAVTEAPGTGAPGTASAETEAPAAEVPETEAPETEAPESEGPAVATQDRSAAPAASESVAALPEQDAAAPVAAPPPDLSPTPPAVEAEAPTSPEGTLGAGALATAPVADTDPPPTTEASSAPILTAEADAGANAPAAPAEPPARPPQDAPAEPSIRADLGAGEVAELPAQVQASGPALTLPQAPGAPGAEAAPVAAELPPPPPLTPEEEALLQPLPDQVAEEGPTDPAVGDGQAESDAPRIADAAPVEPPLVPDEAAPEAQPSARPPVSVGEPDAALPRAAGLGDQVEGVVTGRLPRIGASDPAPAPSAEGVAEAAPVDPQSLPPLQRFARPFDNPQSKPLFAILLVDDGKEANRAELAALSLPLTVVIDPLSEGAAEREAIWRAGGQEVVLAVSGIPQGATASDLEQTFQQLLDRLPDSLAVIDPDGRMFQDNRPLATMVVGILQAEGLGLVTYDRGLNAADQVARRDGVGAARLFRNLDAEGEAAPVIRRYLDRAAFKAAQEGRVAVIGTLRDETVKAIMEWAVEGRSATVALAPISALMAR